VLPPKYVSIRMTWRLAFTVFVGIFSLGLYCAEASARVYIDINAPFLRKIPTAVPVFKDLSPDGSLKSLCRDMSDLLADTIDFTGYFKVLERGSFLEDPGLSGLTRKEINFQNWSVIGAELLIKGGIRKKREFIEVEIRLFDTFARRLLIGKRYVGRIKDQRRIIHRFCNDVILRLTGQRGIFNTRIAFVSTTTGNKEIYICDFDGYNPERFTFNNTITLSPAWSSDGRWLAFTSYRKGKPDLYIKHLKEKRGSKVTFKGINITPAWLPGKFALAATLSLDGNPEIYLLTGAGKKIRRITNNWSIDVSPSWSPDGKRLAFVSNRSGSPQIYIQDIEDGEARRLTYMGSYNTSPCWSPLGDRIAFTGMDNGHLNIYTIKVNGDDLQQLTFNSGNNESPTWSPDGSLIAFSSTREGTSRIYVMNYNGTDQRRLLVMPGEQTEPSWSPWLSEE